MGHKYYCGSEKGIIKKLSEHHKGGSSFSLSISWVIETYLIKHFNKMKYDLY